MALETRPFQPLLYANVPAESLSYAPTFFKTPTMNIQLFLCRAWDGVVHFIDPTLMY